MTIPASFSAKKGNSSPDSNNAAFLKEALGGTGRRGGRGGGRGGSGCCLPCYVLGGVVLLGFVAVAAVLYHSYNLGSTQHAYHEGDQKTLQETGSSVYSMLCEAVTVTTDQGEPANVYLTQGPAAIDPQLGEAVIIRASGLSAEDEYDYRPFYLIAGSSLEAEGCMSVFNPLPRVQAEILFIRGDAAFKQWRGDAGCSHCVQHRVSIPPEVLCEAQLAVAASYVIQDDDVYYVVVTRQHRAQDDLPFRADIEMQMTKTLYNTRDSIKQSCEDSSSCKMMLSYRSRDDVIVEFPFRQDATPELFSYYHVSCELRSEFWLVAFCFIPLGILLFLIFTACVVNYTRQPEVDRQRAMTRKRDLAQRAVVTASDKKLPPV